MKESMRFGKIVSASECRPDRAQPSTEDGAGTQTPETRLSGTANQIAWAEQIRTQVHAEFDRVAKALESVAARQSSQNRENTRAMISILEEKRREVMAHDQAGYFIHDWQELRDQVRRMITEDPRYKATKAADTRS